MAKNLLNHARVFNDGDNAHGILADGTPQRVNMPDPQDQVAPFPGRELERGWWRNARAVRNQVRRPAPVADAPHLVAVPAVVADPLRAGSGICWVMAARKAVAVKISKLRLLLALSRER